MRAHKGNNKTVDEVDSPLVKTVFSFVDHDKTNLVAKTSSTDTALAELYAHVQSMPESAQKRKLIANFNNANGQGTPGIHNKRHGGLKSLLTPKRSASKAASKQQDLGRAASYNLQVHFKTPSKPPSQVLHSFKRQTSEQTTKTETDQKLLSPQSSPAILFSPAEFAVYSSSRLGDG